MPTRVTMMLKDDASYNKYKGEVLSGGGQMIHDYEGLLGFTADLPEQLFSELQSTSSVTGGDILSFEPDSVVTIQNQ
ncbi:hypothetical protein EDC04DRAFT_2632345 [Pisolithus marmoratus]|nr:hypothetical protein EDC04DRAFT_2632345 [Pisolithus marmoratus]